MNIQSALHMSAAAFAPGGRRTSLTLLTLVAAALLALTAHAQTVTSAVPGFITYQGKVSNANGTLVGAGTPVNRNVIFRIWSHQSNGTANDLVYSEQQTVTISEGEFSVLIGQGSALSATPLGYSESPKGPPTTTVASAAVFGGATRFLGVTIDDPATAADPEISPRQQLVTSAYAFRAKYAETVGANGANSLTALDNGNVGIGTGNPGAKLEVTGSIRAGGAGTPTAALSLLANSATTQAMSIGYSSSNGTYSSDAVAGDTVVRTENGGKLLLQSGTGSSALVVDANNNVGIGTANPPVRLSVAGAATTGAPANTGSTAVGNLRISDPSRIAMDFGTINVAPHYPAWIQIHDSAAQNTNYALSLQPNGGHVGIGTTSPASKLHVSGSDGTTHGLGAGIQITNTAAGGNNWYIRTGATGTTTPAGALSFGDNAAYRMVVTKDGRVGIGTTSPVAALHVNGGGSASGTLSYYVDGNGHGGPWGPNYIRGDVSIYASNSIVCPGGFFVISDARTKNVLGVSDGKADLDTLSRIQVSNYTFRDVPVLGPRVQKKVIAQQLEQVFPEAVSQFTEVVADIYQPASISDGWIQLTTDLRPGERVRLISESGTKDLHEVLEVKAGGFRTASPPAGKKVFVYGREVSDFRKVDYDAIAMLNVSATQEIKREKDAEVAELRAANTELRTVNVELAQRVAELEAKDRVRDAKLASIEKLLQTTQTVMARPATTNANGQD